MNTLNFKEMENLINNMRDFGCSNIESYSINENYNIVIIRKALVRILQCINCCTDELDNIIHYNLFKDNEISVKIKNMLGDFNEKDYRDTNIKIEKNDGILNINGSIGFINGNDHINLDSGAKYQFRINSELLREEDLYFIAFINP